MAVEINTPETINSLFATSRSVALQPSNGIDKPEAVIRLMVIDALRQFSRQTRRTPRRIHIPIAIEAALQVDRSRNLGQHGKIRQLDKLFTCIPVWDAQEFMID